MSTSALGTRMREQAAEERGRAIRALLASPLLTVERDPAAFDLVRRHAAELRRWFDDTCGWTLHVEPRRGYARLTKVRPDPDHRRPARRLRSTRAPFDRRRYVMFCLVAAELARPGAMTTVGLLAERVRAATAAEPAIPAFDTASRGERAAFVDAVRLLEHLGVMRAVDGTSDAFVDSPDAKVLYQVDETRLARLLAAPAPPSRLGPEPDLAALLAEPRYGDAPGEGEDVPEAQRNRWHRHMVTRRLLDDPVVYADDLTEGQLAYLATPTGRRVVREAAAAAGFTLEQRAEGWMAVDPDGVATDTRFPDEASHAKHAALLLLDELPAGGSPVPFATLVARVEALLGRFPAWARAYRTDGGARRLADEAVEVLTAFGLAARDRDAGTVAARPAAARYAPADPSAAADPTSAAEPAAANEPSAPAELATLAQPLTPAQPTAPDRGAAP